MSDITLKEAQQRVDDWINQFGYGYWPPHEILARLIEEVGESARLINHLYGSKKKKDSESIQELSLELADILFTVICMANSNHIDLQEAFGRMMSKYTERDGERYKPVAPPRSSAVDA